jgi:arginase family enzyme
MGQYLKKVFGVALDASDDPWSLQLKLASMMSTEKSGDFLDLDPYDALAKHVADFQHFELAGKYPIPSWLGPRPCASNRHLVNAKNLQEFVTNGGFFETKKGVQDFVERKVFPALPIMLGIDHSVTGGVVAALAKIYGQERISIVVLDRHFDGIPLSLRMDSLLKPTLGFNKNRTSGLGDVTAVDQYCCGNFWAYLIEGGIVLPENLLFVGVADYPEKNIDSKWKRFKESYLSLEDRGCSFFPLWKFDGFYVDSLARFLNEKITTPYVYVSLDLDVGAYNCTYAARYMDGKGINRQNLLDIAGIIADGNRNKKYRLVGFDIMEFNMHFLGIKTAKGTKDSTLFLVRDFIKTLTLSREAHQ